MLLALGALGILYGDIGTSPLYAFREAFEGHDLEVTRDGVIGASSLVFWALVVIIGFKYLSLVMRADNKGEGWILALTSLLQHATAGRLAFVPSVPPEQQADVTPVGPGMWQVQLTFGFTDEPNVPHALARLTIADRPIEPDEVTYFFGREAVV